MRIPENTLRTQHLRTYGTAGLEKEDEEKSWGGCPRVFKAKYVEHTLIEPRSFALEYGTAVHDALFIAEEENLPLLPDALQKAWERSEVPLPPEAWQEAVDDLTAFLDRGGLNLATLAVEQELRMPLCEIDGIPFFYGGRLDWIGIDPSEDPIETIYVVDYKTNRAPPSQDDVDRDTQFTGYGLLAKANLRKWLPDVDPESVRVVVIMSALKWYDLRTTREDWQYEAFTDWLVAMCRKIVKDEAGDPILNDGCGWCPIKFDCKEFRRLPGQGATIADRMSTQTDLLQRAYFLQSAQQTISILKKTVEEVKGELLNEAKRRGEPIPVNGIAYVAEEDWDTVWDLKLLEEVLGPAEVMNVVNPVGYKVDAIAKRKPELKAALEKCKTRLPSGEKKLKARKIKSE